MVMAGVKYKLMPTSPDVDLSKVIEDVKKVLEENGGIYSNHEEEPIAFGLKALIVLFAFPEEKEIDDIGNLFDKIENVSSTEMIDYRRALG